MIRHRLSSMLFLNFEFGGPTRDENKIRLVGNTLTRTGEQKRVIKAFTWYLRKNSGIPVSEKYIDASLVPAPEQRNTYGEEVAIKAGKNRSGDLT